MTVSRVVNNSKQVKPDTRARVERAIAQIDFVPNALGRLLAQKLKSANSYLTRSIWGGRSGSHENQLGLGLAIGCARKPQLLPVRVQCQRSHDHVGHDYRKGIHPDAVADPQKGRRRLETTHGSRRLTEVRSGEERRRYPPETVKHWRPRVILILSQSHRIFREWSANPFAPCPTPE